MKKQYWLGGGLALVLITAITLNNSGDNAGDEYASHRQASTAPTAELAAPTAQSTIIPSPASGKSISREAAEVVPAAPPVPIPQPVRQPSSQSADRVQLWDISGDESSTLVDGIPATPIQVDPAHLEGFNVGQTLILPTPDGDMIEADITDTRNDPNGVHVWEGNIANARNEAAVIISRGRTQTHMIIASDSGTFSVVVDNRTGTGTLVDEGHIKEHQAPIDDGIVVGPPDEIPLPVIN